MGWMVKLSHVFFSFKLGGKSHERHKKPTESLFNTEKDTWYTEIKWNYERHEWSVWKSDGGREGNRT